MIAAIQKANHKVPKPQISAKVEQPREKLAKILQTRGMSQADLAQLLGRTAQYVSDLIKGKKAFDPLVAIELEEALENPSAEDWVRWQLAYERQQRHAIAEGEVTRRSLFEQFGFLGDALKLGWIKDNDDPKVLEENTKSFLSKGQFATSDFKFSERLAVEQDHMQVWKIQVIIQANDQKVPEYSKEKMPELIKQLKSLFDEVDKVEKVSSLLNEYGIRFVIVPHIKKCPVDGVASFNNGYPYIGLSLRHAKLDQFWFVLMHELAHIYHEHSDLTPDNLDRRELVSALEAQANETARDWLLQNQAFYDFKWSGRFTLSSIEEFAKESGVHPAIVIGRLKNEGMIPWSKYVRSHPSIREYLIN
jgi:HTH-type transcriptional regulator / antitoxin HigA